MGHRNWTLLPYGSVKLDVDASWDGLASMSTLACDNVGEVLGLSYDNYKVAFALVVKLLSI